MTVPLAYRVILEPDAEDGGYVVFVPAFPSAHTQGETVEDALRNAREVIELELRFALERGLPIPDPDGDLDVRVERVVVRSPAA